MLEKKICWFQRSAILLKKNYSSKKAVGVPKSKKTNICTVVWSFNNLTVLNEFDLAHSNIIPFFEMTIFVTCIFIIF